MPIVMNANAAVKAAAELARRGGNLGQSLQCDVVLSVPEGEALDALRRYQGELAEMFIVSTVTVGQDPMSIPESDWGYSQEFKVPGSDGQEKGKTKAMAWVLAPKKAKCPRCWRYLAPKEEGLCGRCEDVVAELKREEEAVDVGVAGEVGA
jgi:isoleucyl-tRNA synthetase